MDTGKIRPGLYQFTAIDDCSRFLVAGLARRRSAHATLAFLDQVLDESKRELTTTFPGSHVTTRLPIDTVGDGKNERDVVRGS
jgi:hypothetical protein